MRSGAPVAEGTGERQAYGVGLLVVELVAVVPGADLVRAWKRAFAVRFRRGARSGKRKLQLRDRENACVEREAHAMGIARGRVGRILRDRTAVEDAREQGDGGAS